MCGHLDNYVAALDSLDSCPLYGGRDLPVIWRPRPDVLLFVMHASRFWEILYVLIK